MPVNSAGSAGSANGVDGIPWDLSGDPGVTHVLTALTDRMRNLEARVATLETAARSRDDELLAADLKSRGLL